MLKSKLALTVRLIQILASNPGKTVSLSSISKRLTGGVSVSYLEQVAAALMDAEILQSVRGPGGGYRLKADASALTLGNISDIAGCSDGWLSSGALVDQLRSVLVISMATEPEAMEAGKCPMGRPH